MIEFDKQGLIDIINSKEDRKYYIKKYIEDNKELLNRNNFNPLYNNLYMEHRATWNRFLTAFLLLADIDFLPYIKKVKDMMFYKLPITKLDIPDNIKEIRGDALYKCNELKEISLPKNINIASAALDGDDGDSLQKLEIIRYRGTKEDWKNIEDTQLFLPHWGFEYPQSLKQIICTDGTINIK